MMSDETREAIHALSDVLAKSAPTDDLNCADVAGIALKMWSQVEESAAMVPWLTGVIVVLLLVIWMLWAKLHASRARLAEREELYRFHSDYFVAHRDRPDGTETTTTYVPPAPPPIPSPSDHPVPEGVVPVGSKVHVLDFSQPSGLSAGIVVGAQNGQLKVEMGDGLPPLDAPAKDVVVIEYGPMPPPPRSAVEIMQQEGVGAPQAIREAKAERDAYKTATGLHIPDVPEADIAAMTADHHRPTGNPGTATHPPGVIPVGSRVQMRDFTQDTGWSVGTVVAVDGQRNVYVDIGNGEPPNAIPVDSVYVDQLASMPPTPRSATTIMQEDGVGGPQAMRWAAAERGVYFAATGVQVPDEPRSDHPGHAGRSAGE